MMLALNFRQCVADPCLCILDNDEGYVAVSTWVDDCTVAYSNRKQWENTGTNAVEVSIECRRRVELGLGDANQNE